MEQLELADVTIRWISVSDMANNVYLITANASGQQVLIDAADDADAIADLIAAGSGRPLTAVLTTHRHWDHVRALAEVAGEGVTAYAGAADAAAIEAETGAVIDVPVNHAEVLDFDGFSLEAIALRGHTPGSIAFLLRDSSGREVLFSGDSLFPGGPGRTWSEADFASLMDDLGDRVFARLDDAVTVLPGHGEGPTLGAERPHLAQWRERGW